MQHLFLSLKFKNLYYKQELNIKFLFCHMSHHIQDGMNVSYISFKLMCTDTSVLCCETRKK